MRCIIIDNKKEAEKRKMKKILIIVFALVSLGCFAYTAIWYMESQTQNKADTELADLFHHTGNNENIRIVAGTGYDADVAGRSNAPEYSDVPEDSDPFETLREINPDIIGWIAIDHTRIDYPVVQGKDNEYYLHTSIYGENSRFGTIFLDFRCHMEDPVRVIYGHHMKDGSMFSDLIKFMEPGFRETSPVVHLYAVNGGYEAFQAVEVRLWDAGNTEEQCIYEYLNNLSLLYPSPLVCLVTCDYTFQDARLLVIAERIN
jgi:sortase B